MKFWDEAKEAALRVLWPSGKSAREIANELGAPTRNMIIGKARRMRILKNPDKPVLGRKYKTAPQQRVQQIAWPIILEPPVVETDHSVSLYDVKTGQCRCIVKRMTFCGKKVVHASSWCDKHYDKFVVLARHR